MQDAIRKDVAALKVSRQLHFIDGEEGHPQVRRHGLDGADPIAWACGDNLFFAGDQRHGVVAGFQSHAVIDLTGEQPEWQADHAAGMGQHALNRQMGFTGVGGAQHRRNGWCRRMC